MRTRTLLRRLVLFGVPLILGGLEIFHPVPGTSGIVATLSPQVTWWPTLHLLQLPLVGLLAVAVLLLTAGLPGWVTTISRIGVWFFVVFYLAVDDIAGIANGISIRTAQGLPPSQLAGIEHVVQALFFDPLVGGNNPFSALYVLGVGGVAGGCHCSSHRALSCTQDIMDTARPACAGSDRVWLWTWFAHWPTWHALLLGCRSVDRACAFATDSKPTCSGRSQSATRGF